MRIVFILVIILFACRSVPEYTAHYRAVVSYLDTAQSASEFIKAKSKEAFDADRALPLALYDTAFYTVIGASFSKRIYKERHNLSSDTIPRELQLAMYREQGELFQNPERFPLLKLGLPIADSTSRFILFLSPFFNNMIVAEILPVRTGVDELDYRQITRFKQGIKFLFVFDDNGKLRDVSSTLIFYD